MRTAIYIQESATTSPRDTENKLTQLKELAKKQSWTITKIYREKDTVPNTLSTRRPGSKNGHSRDTSGTSFQFPKNRVALLEMVDAGKKNRFDVLLFWSLDELAPRTGALASLNFLHLLNTCGIQYRSFTEAYLDSTGSRSESVVSILATLVKQESLRLSQLTHEGLERQKRLGTLGPGGRSGPGKPPVEFDHDKARKLRAKGKSYSEIAELCGVSKATVFRYLNQ